MNRTQTSLILTFLFAYSTWIFYLKWGNFQRKLGGEIAGEFRRLPTPIETMTVYDEGRTLDKHPYS